MAQTTYSDAATSGTSQAIKVDAGQATADDGDRVIKKIIVGKPTAGATLTVFKPNNALANNTTDIALKYTYPTFAAGAPATDVFTFVSGEKAASSSQVDGLVLPGGGSFITSSAMQVTVIWDYPEA